MTKAELIELLTKKKSHLNKADIDLAVDCIFEHMNRALAANQRIEIRGFGSFSLRYLGPRRGRNPLTGEVLDLPERYSVHFRPGKDLKLCVDKSRFTNQIEYEDAEQG